jgi:hypothetical protein
MEKLGHQLLQLGRKVTQVVITVNIPGIGIWMLFGRIGVGRGGVF